MGEEGSGEGKEKENEQDIVIFPPRPPREVAAVTLGAVYLRLTSKKKKHLLFVIYVF